MASNQESARGLPQLLNIPGVRLLAAVLTAAALGYIAWKIGQSPPQALQFAFNGLAVGAVYALLAMGFTLVYSTVWFFDLYYGAAAALGAYGVFYLRTAAALGSRSDINSIYVNAVFAAVVCGVATWCLYTALYPRLRSRSSPGTIKFVAGLLGVAVGSYAGVVLSYPAFLHVTLSPAVGLAVAVAVVALACRAAQAVLPSLRLSLVVGIAAVPGAALGAWCGYLLSARSRIRPVPELGGVLPAVRRCRPGPLPRPLCLHAPAGAFTLDHAGGFAGNPARHCRVHRHRL